MDLLNSVPPGTAYTVLGLAGTLPTAREKEGLRAFCHGLQHLLSGDVAILIAVTGLGGHHPTFADILNVGWSDEWIDLYLAADFANVDPVLNGKPDTPILWSKSLATLNRRTPSHARFLAACARHDMTHGLTYLHDHGTHRVTISFAGRRAEEDAGVRQIIGMMHRHMSSAASRVLAPRDLRYELTDMDRSIADSIAVGQSDTQTASNLGITARTVRRHVARIIKQYKARSRAHLVYILFGNPNNT